MVIPHLLNHPIDPKGLATLVMLADTPRPWAIPSFGAVDGEALTSEIPRLLRAD
jgi:hypothetical protein